MKKFTLGLINLCFILALAGCGGGGGGATAEETPTPTPIPAKTGSISGTVQNAKSKLPIEGLTVTVNGIDVITTATGNYTIASVKSAERIVVTVKGSGYAEQSKIVSISTQDQNVDLNISVLPVDTIDTFDPDLARDITVTGSSAMVKLGATAFVQADGSTLPSGMVTANLTVIDPTTNIELMPGDMQTDEGGSLTQIESFGAITATFKDDNGNALNLAAGSPATIRIPVPTASVNPPTTIPLFYYDKETGLWVKEGSATLDVTKTYYEGTVTHFSTWNADQVYDRVTINGCVEDELGAKLSNIYVVSKGVDYSGASYGITDDSGNFSVFAKSNASVSVYGQKVFTRTSTVAVQTTTSDFTITPCLVLLKGDEPTGPSGGTLTLSGADTSIVGATLKFGEVIDYLSTVDTHYIFGFDESVQFIDGSFTQANPNYSFSMILFTEQGKTTAVLSIKINNDEYAYSCNINGVTIETCGAETIAFDSVNKTVTFSDTLLQRFQLNSAGTALELIDMRISGTLTWKDFSLFGLPI